MAVGTAPRRAIVVGFDGSSAAHAALEWAARQAELTGDHLELVTTWEWPTSYGFAVPVAKDFDPAATAAQILDDAVGKARHGHPDVEIRTAVVEGPAGRSLVESSDGASLLVVGSRGHGELAGLLFGSVSEHCVSHAHCPVVVVRGDAE